MIRISLASLLALVTTCPHLCARVCKQPNQLLNQTITSYVLSRYGNEGATDLQITNISFVENTCYRKIIIESSSGNRRITLYLTPDEKYLTTNLMDISKVPRAAPLLQDHDTTKLLLAGTPLGLSVVARMPSSLRN